VIDGLKPYPKMKDSGVEWLREVPAHWDVVPAMAAYRPRQAKNTGMVESTVLSLSYGKIVVRPPEKLRGLVPESFETYQIVEPGNIIIRTTDLQNDQTSLRIGYSQHRGIITSAYLCLECAAGFDSTYGYQLLNAYDILKILYGYGSGLRQNLAFSDIKRMPVLRPPIHEQQDIVRFLDHTDRRIRRYIRAKQKLIKLLEEHKQAIIHRAVTRGPNPDVRLKPSGVEFLGDVPEHWEILPFVRCVAERADYRGATPEKVDSGVFLVTAKNIRRGWIDYEASKEYVRLDQYEKIMRRGHPRVGDLLFTTEAPLGHVAMVDREEVAIAQRVIRFRVSEAVRPAFALASMLSPYFQAQLSARATGSTAQGIKASKLPQLVFLKPPLHEQDEILTALGSATAELDAAVAATRREVTLLTEMKIRLITDVVTGKLDVREAVARLPDEPDDDATSETDDVVDDADVAEELDDMLEEVEA